METDRFRNYDSEVRDLVLEFEKMCQNQTQQFFDVEELEIIIDYYLENEDISNMKKAVDFALSLYPHSNEINLRQAQLLSVDGHYDSALSILKELEAIEPDNTDIKYTLGAVYSSLSQPREAIRYLQEASADGFELNIIYSNMAEEYTKLEDFDSAKRYYKKALDIEPSDSQVINNLYITYDRLEQYDEAITYFDEFVTRHPYSEWGWNSLGLAYSSLGLYEKAIDAFEYVLVINPDNLPAYHNLSSCYLNLGNPSKAVSYLREGLEYDPNPALSLFFIGQIYQDNHNFQSAVIYYKKALNSDPLFAEAWMAASECYCGLHDYSTAIDHANHAMAINPESPDFACRTAYIHHYFDHPDEAEPLYICAIKLDPTQEGFWLDYSDLMIDSERYEEAAELLQEGVINADNTFPFYLRMALCFYRMGLRNRLFNVVRACMTNAPERINELFELCPEMGSDIDVMNIINSD